MAVLDFLLHVREETIETGECFLGNAMHNIIGDNQRLSRSTVAFLRKTSVHVGIGVVEIRAYILCSPFTSLSTFTCMQ